MATRSAPSARRAATGRALGRARRAARRAAGVRALRAGALAGRGPGELERRPSAAGQRARHGLERHRRRGVRQRRGRRRIDLPAGHARLDPAAALGRRRCRARHPLLRARSRCSSGPGRAPAACSSSWERRPARAGRPPCSAASARPGTRSSPKACSTSSTQAFAMQFERPAAAAGRPRHARRHRHLLQPVDAASRWAATASPSKAGPRRPCC